MKDLEIPVITVALKPLYDFSPTRFVLKVHALFFTFLFSNKNYKAPFLEPQGHARMKDLKISVLMVALKHLHDFSRPISCQQFVFVHVCVSSFSKRL